MTRTRALAIPAAVLALSGCGVAAAVTARTTTVSVTLPKPRPEVSSAPVLTVPQPVVTPAPSAPPVVAPPTPYIVDTVPVSGGREWLEIRDTSGRVVARTQISPALAWLTAAGPGGAYWTAQGAEYQLTPSGAVHRLGSVPVNANGVLIAPDGVSYAYATSDQSTNTVSVNRIVVVRPGRPATVIADRVSDSNHPSTDAPASWDYYLISWTTPGITFARVPQGGCGCGAFDMQMQSAYSAIINPTTDVVTSLTSDPACPLSAVSAGMEVACFTGTASSTGLRISAGGTPSYHFTLSGANLSGDTVFSPSGAALAYVTIPAAENTCGATWTTTLRVLNLATGTAVSRAVGDFAPSVWASNGMIYGTVTDAAGAELVAVNPTSLAVTRLAMSTSSMQLVGLT